MSEPVKCFMVERVGEDPTRWRRAETGEEFAFRDMPPGAIWDASWMGVPVNGDGPSLVVKLPNGNEWLPGSTAANCSRRGQDHDCWCVHGEPPNLTVDKEPEPGRSTCTAGAGSISSGEGPHNWHGFLRDGCLVDA